MTPGQPPARRSFSELSLYAACPLKYRYLRVDGKPEPAVAPDWSRAPRRVVEEEVPPAGVASSLDRLLGTAVHAALARWQRAVDGGGSRRGADLLDLARREARATGIAGAELDQGIHRLEAGLRGYAEGPWPRQATLFLEQTVRHVLTGADGASVELHLRVDRVVRHRRAVAILDFKTVSPHALEMRADAWQLRTYALAAPEMLGMPSTALRLVIVDLRAAEDREVPNDAALLRVAASELLACAAGIAAGEFDTSRGHDDRPCWSCGFRLECPASLSPEPPRRPLPGAL
ncbi:MAG: PD-(D/E)XK nuclease family protein [Candidatus Dormibacteria bacterium]